MYSSKFPKSTTVTFGQKYLKVDARGSMTLPGSLAALTELRVA